MTKLLREYFAKLRPPVRVRRWSSLETRTEYIRQFAIGPDGNKVIVRKQVTSRRMGPITDEDLLSAWNHLTDEQLLEAVQQAEENPLSAHVYAVRCRAAKLRGLL